jgi:hypothetical protein
VGQRELGRLIVIIGPWLLSTGPFSAMQLFEVKRAMLARLLIDGGGTVNLLAEAMRNLRESVGVGHRRSRMIP